LTRWFIKTALVYFILALIAGIISAVSNLPGLFPVYIHLLVEGWITLLIIGVVIWMFPKYSRELPRGNEKLGWTSYILLNTGLVLRLVSEPLNTLGEAPESLWGVLLVISAILQWLGGMAFVVNTWSRVKVK